MQYTRVNENEDKEGRKQAREVAVEQLLRTKMTMALNTIMHQCPIVYLKALGKVKSRYTTDMYQMVVRNYTTTTAEQISHGKALALCGVLTCKKYTDTYRHRIGPWFL